MAVHRDPRSSTRAAPRAVRLAVRALGAAAAGVVGLVVLPAAPAGAVPVQVPVPAASDHLASISLELAGVRVDGPEYRVVKRRYDDTIAALVGIHQARLAAEAELARLHGEDVRLTGEIATRTATRKHLRLEMVEVRANLRDIAITSYVRGTELEPTREMLGVDELTDRLAENVLFSTVDANQEDRLHRVAGQLDAETSALNRAATERQQVRTRAVEVDLERQRASEEQARLTAEAVQRRDELDQARAIATVVGADFSLVALDAYWLAAQTLASELPRCGIEWWALAGISRIEGRHGTFGQSQLRGDGTSEPPIIGIPLNGENETAVILDSDAGEMDGDPEFDRAVGPMQFIPDTWRRWDHDGNGDGLADPHNLYDAAVSAGHYLCAGGPMQTDEDLLRGYFSYNHSDVYAEVVLSYAAAYSQFRIPPPPTPESDPLVALAATAPAIPGG